MTASHHVDELNRLIITNWKGDADVGKFVRSFQHYQKSIKNRPEYDDYNEIINFSGVRKLDFNLRDLKDYARFVASFDKNQPIKMAMIVNNGPAYVLAKGYVVIRKLVKGSRKEVRVFHNHFDALKWFNGA